MEEAVFAIGMLAEVAAIAFLFWILRRKNYALFCETVDHFPENLRRRIAWRKRRILRAWDRLRVACLQCHVAGIKK